MQPEGIFPIILAGGRGTRLRPFVRRGRGKPFVALGKSNNLLQDTIVRASAFAPPVIVTHKDYVDQVERSYDGLSLYDLRPRTIIGEPVGRSTAPAIAAGALSLPPYATFVVMPCDHVFGNDRSLAQAVLDAAAHVQRYGGVVSVGAKPLYAARRYGYVHKGDAVVDGGVVHHSHDFLEKPGSEHARICARSGAFLWNTGVFVARVADYLAAFQEADTLAFALTRKAFEYSQQDNHIYHLYDEPYYQLSKGLAVDTAVLTPMKNRYVVRYEGYWGDVGTVPAYLGAAFLRMCGILKE